MHRRRGAFSDDETVAECGSCGARSPLVYWTRAPPPRASAPRCRAQSTEMLPRGRDDRVTTAPRASAPWRRPSRPRCSRPSAPRRSCYRWRPAPPSGWRTQRERSPARRASRGVGRGFARRAARGLGGGAWRYLDEAGPAVEVEVQIADLAKVAEFVVDIVLLRLLVQPRDEHDPALDCCARRGVSPGPCWGGRMQRAHIWRVP